MLRKMSRMMGWMPTRPEMDRAFQPQELRSQKPTRTVAQKTWRGMSLTRKTTSASHAKILLFEPFATLDNQLSGRLPTTS